MKFLCLECNTAMKFKESKAPEGGALTAIFECPDCFGEIAMHMNPWETQMLKSLDVQLGGKSDSAPPMQMVRSFLSDPNEGAFSSGHAPEHASSTASEPEGGKCPFTSVVADAFQNQAPEPVDLVWTEDALERLNRIPSFVQSMAKAGIEEFAREKGIAEITGEVMDAARGNFGM
ncbi:MAG: PCP reductase family protein [Candidatus Poribacteria bacterium]|nr:PCP reductase family protein [Candidatus Poribacteria bacterium]MDE0506218.1 PCP reductase family protein [Candidatus Poribacteria bacterium]